MSTPKTGRNSRHQILLLSDSKGSTFISLTYSKGSHPHSSFTFREVHMQASLSLPGPASGLFCTSKSDLIPLLHFDGPSSSSFDDLQGPFLTLALFEGFILMPLLDLEESILMHTLTRSKTILIPVSYIKASVPIPPSQYGWITVVPSKGSILPWTLECAPSFTLRMVHAHSSSCPLIRYGSSRGHTHTHPWTLWHTHFQTSTFNSTNACTDIQTFTQKTRHIKTDKHIHLKIRCREDTKLWKSPLTWRCLKPSLQLHCSTALTLETPSLSVK